jgi:hypothetical protein
MASPYAFQLAQPPPPTSRRGISPAASISSIFGRNRSPQPPPAQSSGTPGVAAGYNPAMYTNQVGGAQHVHHVQHVQHAQHIPPSIPNVAGPHCIRRPSMSPMRRVGEDGGAGRAYNPQAYGQLQNGGAFVPAARQEQEEGRVNDFRFFIFAMFFGFWSTFCATNGVSVFTNQVNLSLFTHFHIPHFQVLQVHSTNWVSFHEPGQFISIYAFSYPALPSTPSTFYKLGFIP